VSPSAATGVESSANFRGNHNTIYMDSQATTNQSTSASQNTSSTQGQSVQPGQNAGVPGMGAVPGVSSGVAGGASAATGGTSSEAGGAINSKVDMSDGPGKRGKGHAKGHQKQKDRR
jgi:hypothetical protein